MNYAKIRELDISNGPGVRTTLFVSGCTFYCKSCFNKEAQSFNYGEEFTKEIEDYFVEISKKSNIKGINLLGGEVMHQDTSTILSLVKRLKEEVGKDTWLWTGYTWEELIKLKDKIDILQYIDVLIDGRFDVNKRDLMLKYRGSSNQRVIDVQKSLKQNKIVIKE